MDDRARIVDLRRTFVTPPELLRSMPRDVALTAGGKALYLFAMVLFVAAFVAGVAFYTEASRQAERWRTFDRDSVETRAEVTRLWRGSGDSKPYLLAYRFQASDLEYRGQSRVRSSFWRAREIGSPVDVRYLPDDPSQSVIVGAERRQLPIWLAFVIASALGCSGALCLIALNGQRRLLMEGRAAPALITSIVKHHTSHGGTHRAVEYTFPLLSGGIAAGKSEAGGKPPAVGSVICIVYDPDRPGKSRPYPFPLVQTTRFQ